MDIPEHLEREIEDAVTHHLATALGNRRLLLTADELAVAQSEAVTLGERLLTSLLHQCYPVPDGHIVEFERGGDVVRIGAALAFGAVTSRVLATVPPKPAVELLCATFNLGIGLIDGVCDGDVDSGQRLLRHLDAADLTNATQQNRERGWLRVGLPVDLAEDLSVAFTVDVVAAFFETLHQVYPGATHARVRRTVGAQLVRALEAESRSVVSSLGRASRRDLIEYSRSTSVIPLEIIETLSTAGSISTAGTLLGEAMWWIDDLVDLCDDAGSGALNGIILCATDHSRRCRVTDLERLIASGDLAATAVRAAASFHTALQCAAQDRNAFLQFVQRYAGIAPAAGS